MASFCSTKRNGDTAARDLGQQARNLLPANAPPDGVCSFGVIGASLTVETERRAAAPRAVRGCMADAPIVSRRRRPPVNSALRLYGRSRNVKRRTSRNVKRRTKRSVVPPQSAQEPPSAASSHRTASEALAFGPRLRYVSGPGRRPPTALPRQPTPASSARRVKNTAQFTVCCTDAVTPSVLAVTPPSRRSIRRASLYFQIR